MRSTAHRCDWPRCRQPLALTIQVGRRSVNLCSGHYAQVCDEQDRQGGSIAAAVGRHVRVRRAG